MPISPVKNPRQPNPFTIALKEASQKYSKAYLRFERAKDTPDYSSDVVTTVVFYEDGPEFALYKLVGGKNDWALLGEYRNIAHLEDERFTQQLVSEAEYASLTALKLKESMPISLHISGARLTCKIVRLKLDALEVKAQPGLIHNGNTSDSATVVINEGTTNERSVVNYTGVYAPSGGSWSLLGMDNRLKTILNLFPDYASLKFEVQLEAGATIGEVVKSGMHLAALTLKAEWLLNRKSHLVNLLLDVHMTSHGPGRFGCNYPQIVRQVKDI